MPPVPPGDTGIPTPAPQSPLGRFGDYELLEEIARGGMGVVFKARQASLDRLVAVKMLLFGPLASAEVVQRFRTEAAAAASLQHPNIVAIHEVGFRDGQHFIAMDYVAGRNLAEIVRDGPLPPKRAAAYVRTIADAIQFAHERGILHRDLKPSNVLIDEHDQPKVMDFGLAKRLEKESELTLSGQVLGSPSYMPPEQAAADRGLVGKRSDVYSLGAILYHLLTGRAPFVAPTVAETLQQVQKAEPVSPTVLNPHLPRDLKTICLKCLEKEPARRYQTAQELTEELGRFLKNEPILARPIGPAGKAWRWCRRNPRVASLGLAASALLLLVLIGSPIAAWRINRARQLAEVRELQARDREYVAHMNLAQQSLAAGDFGRAVRLVEQHRPSSAQTDLRGFEWRYLWRLCQGDEHVPFPTQDGMVLAAAYSPDGKYLALGLGDRVTIWEVGAKRLVRELPRGAFSLAFSPDGKTLATVNVSVTIWNTESWQEQTLPFAGEREPLALSADGTRLATVSDQGVRVWQTATWSEVLLIPDVHGPLALAHDGQRLAAYAPSGLRIYAVDTNRSSVFLQGSASMFEHPSGWLRNAKVLTFSRDGRRLMAARYRREAADGTARISFTVSVWDAATGEEIATLPEDPDRLEHTGPICCIDLAPDGSTLATASWDHSIKLWDLTRRKCIGTRQGHRLEVWSVAFAPDGKTLVSGGTDDGVKLWNTGPAVSEDSVPGQLLPLAFSKDGQTLVASGVTQVSFHSVAQPQTEKVPRLDLGPLLDPQGLTPLLALDESLNWLAYGRNDGTVQLWEARRARLRATFTNHTGPVELVALSPNGQWLVSAGQDKTLRWRNLSGGTGPVFDLKTDNVLFSPDNRTLATLHPDRTLRLWEVTTQTARVIPTDHIRQVVALAFSFDCQKVATAGLDNSVRLWEVASGRWLRELQGHKQGVVAVAFSPDGRTLASGSEDGLKLWNLATGEEVLSFRPAGLMTAALLFSPDGKTLAAGSLLPGPNALRLYRAPSWEEIAAAEAGKTSNR